MPDHAGAMEIVNSIHGQFVAAASAALAAGDAKAAIENAQNAINLKGRDPQARSILSEAKTLGKSQEKAANQ